MMTSKDNKRKCAYNIEEEAEEELVMMTTMTPPSTDDFSLQSEEEVS
jgi:hypothetical protein